MKNLFGGSHVAGTDVPSDQAATGLLEAEGDTERDGEEIIHERVEGLLLDSNHSGN